MKYQRILRAVYSTPWAIEPDKLEAIIGFLQMKADGFDPNEVLLAEIRAESQMLAARRSALAQAPGDVALLPLFGVLSHRANMVSESSGGTSLDKFSMAFRQCMADPNCKAIVLDVDSPGGQVDGVPELADEIFSARGRKPITAVANTLMASAAYWLSSSCGEIVASPSALVGSIGVIAKHEDSTGTDEMQGRKVTYISSAPYKAEGMSPMNDDALAALQSMVDEVGAVFEGAVARGRGISAAKVKSNFGQGRIVTADRAKSVGMVDRIATLDQVLGKLGVARGGSTRAFAQVDIGALEGSYQPENMMPVDGTQAECAADATRREIAELWRRLELAGA